MKILFAALLISSFGAFAETSLEDFFTCKNERGAVVAKVFVEPEIFCGNNRKNPATLMVQSGDSSNLFNGELLRWESGKGESFLYKKGDGEDEFQVSATLPYGVGKGVLATLVNGEVRSMQEMTCVTKQIHVDCH